MKFIIVDKASLQIMGSYEAEQKDDTSANRSWLAAEPMAKHLELPEGLLEDECEAVLDEQGEIKLQHSAAKEQQKLANAWAALRNKRNILISDTDKYLLPDYPISEEKLAEMKEYRNSLRDLPSQVVDPRDEVSFPVKPEL